MGILEGKKVGKLLGTADAGSVVGLPALTVGSRVVGNDDGPTEGAGEGAGDSLGALLGKIMGC